MSEYADGIRLKEFVAPIVAAQNIEAIQRVLESAPRGMKLFGLVTSLGPLKAEAPLTEVRQDSQSLNSSMHAVR